MHLLIHVLAFFHIENVAKEYVAVEAEEAGAEGQEEQQEFEVSEQVENQVHETDFANSDPQQGKHRFMLIPEFLHYI